MVTYEEWVRKVPQRLGRLYGRIIHGEVAREEAEREVEEVRAYHEKVYRDVIRDILVNKINGYTATFEGRRVPEEDKWKAYYDIGKAFLGFVEASFRTRYFGVCFVPTTLLFDPLGADLGVDTKLSWAWLGVHRPFRVLGAVRLNEVVQEVCVMYSWFMTRAGEKVELEMVVR